LQKFVCGLRFLLLYQLILAGAGCYLFVIQVLRSMLASDTFLSWAIDIVEHTLLGIYSVGLAQNANLKCSANIMLCLFDHHQSAIMHKVFLFHAIVISG
jgi:hypothetical protein